MQDTLCKQIYNEIIKKFEGTDEKNIINHDLVCDAFKKRRPDVHKGDCGSLLVCAGSPGLTGAAALACQASLVCGSGLITLCCMDRLNTIFEIKLTEVMTLGVKSTKKSISKKAYKQIEKKLNSSDAMLFGPGISRQKDVGILLGKILKSSTVPIVIDADGLYLLSKNIKLLKNTKSNVILTPHIGEFAYLTGLGIEYIIKNKHELAFNFAKQNGCILVLKSHETLVTDGDVIYKNILGNPGMATGGCGDVLSGTIASLVSQNNPPLLSALAGVYIHSLSADIAKEKTGEYSLTPTDIIDNIKYAIMNTTN